MTTIHVSHSIEEAFSVGDRAAVLHDGRLVQAAPLTQLLRRPATEFVARFFRSENLIDAIATPLPDGGAELAFAGHTLRTEGNHEGAVTFVIRPEALEVHPADARAPNGIPAVLKQVSDRGPYRRLEFDAGVSIVAYTTARADFVGSSAGQPYIVAFPPDALHILPSPGLSRPA